MSLRIKFNKKNKRKTYKKNTKNKRKTYKKIGGMMTRSKSLTEAQTRGNSIVQVPTSHGTRISQGSVVRKTKKSNVYFKQRGLDIKLPPLVNLPVGINREVISPVINLNIMDEGQIHSLRVLLNNALERLKTMVIISGTSQLSPGNITKCTDFYNAVSLLEKYIAIRNHDLDIYKIAEELIRLTQTDYDSIGEDEALVLEKKKRASDIGYLLAFFEDKFEDKCLAQYRHSDLVSATFIFSTASTIHQSSIDNHAVKNQTLDSILTPFLMVEQTRLDIIPHFLSNPEPVSQEIARLLNEPANIPTLLTNSYFKLEILKLYLREPANILALFDVPIFIEPLLTTILSNPENTRAFLTSFLSNRENIDSVLIILSNPENIRDFLTQISRDDVTPANIREFLTEGFDLQDLKEILLNVILSNPESIKNILRVQLSEQAKNDLSIAFSISVNENIKRFLTNILTNPANEVVPANQVGQNNFTSLNIEEYKNNPANLEAVRQYEINYEQQLILNDGEFNRWYNDFNRQLMLPDDGSPHKLHVDDTIAFFRTMPENYDLMVDELKSTEADEEADEEETKLAKLNNILKKLFYIYSYYATFLTASKQAIYLHVGTINRILGEFQVPRIAELLRDEHLRVL